MSGHGRKNGERRSHPFPVWNGLLEHRPKIGPAIWVYLWLLDKITSEQGAKGIVLGGSPVKAAQIASDLDVDEHTVRRDLRRLTGSYIEVVRTPYGYRVFVLNSRKFGIWRSAKNGLSESERSAKNVPQIGQKWPDRSAKSGRNKEDSAVDAARRRSSGTAPRLHPAWTALGIEAPVGSALFQGEWQDYFEAHQPNGRTVSQIAEDFIQYRDARGMKCPPGFYQAKHDVERRDRETRGASSEPDPLAEIKARPQEIPEWQTKA